MDRKFTPIRKDRLSEHVTRVLLEMIRSGRLKPGDHLPSERELSEKFNISRNSIREALKVMESMGYIETRTGSGGGSSILEVAVDSCIEPFIDALGHDRKTLVEMLDFRLIIETEFARIAAQSAGPEDLLAIRMALVLMEQEIASGGVGLAGDNTFHEAVAAATHNNLYLKMLKMAKGLLSRSREATLQIRNQPEKSLKDHVEIFEAIEMGQSSCAAQRMRSHLLRARAHMVSFWKQEMRTDAGLYSYAMEE